MNDGRIILTTTSYLQRQVGYLIDAEKLSANICSKWRRNHLATYPTGKKLELRVDLGGFVPDCGGCGLRVNQAPNLDKEFINPPVALRHALLNGLGFSLCTGGSDAQLFGTMDSIPESRKPFPFSIVSVFESGYFSI